MKPRAVGYVRVSSDEQVEGLSLDAQRHEIAGHCETHGYDLITYYADEGISAYTDYIEKRPAFAEMLGQAERGGFDLVIVRDLSRFARRSSVQSVAFERLGRAGVGFASLKENIDLTTPSGKLMLTMMGGINEFQSAQTGLHVSASHGERARRGLPLGGIPFGYIIHETGGAPVIDEREASAVREAFERRARGETYGTIARWLNDEGLTTQKGRAFTSFAVKDLLANRFFVGVVTHKGAEYPGQHEAIIDEALFERVQLRRYRGRAPRSAPVTRGALSGRIRCGRCTRPLWSDRTHSGSALYREQHGQACATGGRSIQAKVIDEQVGVIFGALKLRPELRDAVLCETSRVHGRVDVKAVHAQRRRLARAYGDGAYSDAEYEARMREINREIERAMPADIPILEDAAALLEHLPQVWTEATFDERRELVTPLIEQVYVDIGTRRIAGLLPAPAFRTLLESAVRAAPDASVVLLPPAAGGLGLVETGEN
ncbi:MAG: hypothetical protein GEU80_07110 [Dehalococcoidia bacterium]|nr:hypothetical protein [Dehalococcoidia bacterium]